MNQNRHSKHQKMTAVREAGFCMIDAGMYLDTHPCDGKAMDYFNRYQQMYKEAVCDYEKHCGPLFLTGIDTNDGWTWTDEPWPWEGGCIGKSNNQSAGWTVVLRVIKRFFHFRLSLK